MNNFKDRFSAKNITGVAVLLALVIVLQAVGGTISLPGGVQLNFTLIPIVLGAILFGEWVGGFLGLACGVVVVISLASGTGGFFSDVFLRTPVITTLTCLIKTSVAGYLAGLFYRLIAKKSKIAGVFVASATVPIINTALFIVGCTIMELSGDLLRIEGYEGTNFIFFLLVVLVSFNFFIELGINLVFAPALDRVIRVVEKRVSKNYNEEVETEEVSKEKDDITEEE